MNFNRELLGTVVDLATLDGDTASCRGRDSDTFTLHLPGSVDT